MQTFSQMIKTLKQLRGYEKDDELLKDLNMKQGTFSSYKTRNKIPFEEIAVYCSDHQLPLELVIFGTDYDTYQKHLKQVGSQNDEELIELQKTIKELEGKVDDKEKLIKSYEKYIAKIDKENEALLARVEYLEKIKASNQKG